MSAPSNFSRDSHISREGRLLTWIKAGHEGQGGEDFDPAFASPRVSAFSSKSSVGNDANAIALAGLLKRRWQLIAGIVGLGLVLALLASLLIRKEYTATADILVVPRGARVAQLEAADISSNTESTFVDNQVEILKSNTLLERLVDKLQLTRDPEFAKIQSRKSWSLFGGGKSDDNVQVDAATPVTPAGSGQPAADPVQATASQPVGANPSADSGPATPAVQPPANETQAAAPAAVDSDEATVDPAVLRSSVAASLADKFKISRVGLTYIVHVAATSKSPERAAQLANELVSLYLVDELDTRVENKRRTADWLQSQLRELGAKLQASEQAAEAFRSANNLVAAGGRTLTDQQRTDLNSQLILARSDAVAKETRLREVSNLVHSGGNIESVSEVLASNVIADLRMKQAEATKQEADLVNRYGELHPELLKVRAQLRDINSQIQAEANRIVSNLDSEVRQARARVSALNDELNGLDREADTNNQASIQLRNLESEVDTNQQLYQSLMEGSKKTSILSDADGMEPPARVTADAQVPQNASFPKPLLFVAVGLILSLGVAVAVVALLEIFDRGYRSTDRAEEHLGIPALATLPLIAQKDMDENQVSNLPEYLLKNPMSAFAESLRKMRASLNFSNIDNPPRSVLVTSSLPNEGKTTLACSLATSLSLSGFKTLLIDCDLRHPSVAKALGATPKLGIVDVLSGETTLDQAVEKLGYQRPDVLYCTSQSANSADLLDSAAMMELVATARERYDYVVVDSPPVLPIVDPVILARKMDTVVFSVRWDQTPREASAIALRRLLDSDARVAGFVLNAVDVVKMARTSISHGDEYYYYGHYSDYYAKKGEAA